MTRGTIVTDLNYIPQVVESKGLLYEKLISSLNVYLLVLGKITPEGRAELLDG